MDNAEILETLGTQEKFEDTKGTNIDLYNTTDKTKDRAKKRTKKPIMNPVIWKG
jgi:hypothetical protein